MCVVFQTSLVPIQKSANLKRTESRLAHARFCTKDAHLSGANIMTDDKDNAGAPDRDRINITEDYELRYWSHTLDVTADELRAAVNTVGSSTRAVRAYFGK
jgi:hypothetical protein